MRIDPEMESDGLTFSPVRGGPFRRLRAALGLVPDNGLGLGRRVAAIIAVAWLPVVIGALVAGQALEGKASDPLQRHFGVHARFLLSVPLMFLAEAIMDRMIPQMIRHFVTSGLVDQATLPQFRAALQHAKQLRDSRWGFFFVLAAMCFGYYSFTTNSLMQDEFRWAMENADGTSGIGFAGWWYVIVSRPIFSGLLAIWVWRIVVLWGLMWKLSELDLRLVASHPDGVGGLGFLESTSVVTVPLVLSATVVIAGRWGHEVLFHGLHVDSLKPLVVALLLLVLLISNGPLLLLGKNLRSFKRKCLLDYSTLVGNHGHLVYQKWAQNKDVGSPELLNAPELGPAADIMTLYDSVAKMRFAPISKESLIPTLLAVALPILPVFAIEIPIRQMLGSLAGALL